MALSDSNYERGMKTRRSVLGDAHVDRANARKTGFDEDFQQFITENVWGDVWQREGLSHRDKSLLIIVMLASLGHTEELAMHIRASQNTGTTLEDVREALMLVGVYAGIPAANTAFKIAKDVYEEK